MINSDCIPHPADGETTTSREGCTSAGPPRASASRASVSEDRSERTGAEPALFPERYTEVLRQLHQAHNSLALSQEDGHCLQAELEDARQQLHLAFSLLDEQDEARAEIAGLRAEA